MIDLDSIVLFNDSPVVEVLMNLILTQGMLDVALLDLLAPAVIKVMNLACDFSAVLQVISLVYL